MKVAILDDYQDVFHEYGFHQRLPGHEVVVFKDTEKDPARLIERIADFDVIVLNAQRSAIPRTLIEKLPKLKLVMQTGSLKDHLDLAACTEHGVAVANVKSGVSYGTAELTWALILASLRHVPFESQQLKQGHWQSTMGMGLRGNNLAVYGLGKIGSCVAQVGHAFGMKVSCWGQEASKARARELGYDVPASREAFIENADVLTLHLRYKRETHGIITAADLACMKPTALIVNTSRAGLVEDGALVRALQKGRPGYAAVDVYEDEPIVGGNHPLLKLPNALCTPHIGGVVSGAHAQRYEHAVEAIVGFANGKPVHIVNPEALRRR